MPGLARKPALLAFGLLFAGGAFAGETPAPPVPAPPVNAQEAESLHGFAVSHPQCNEWSDGCAVCARDAGVKCSTPGIACQPAEIVCKAP